MDFWKMNGAGNDFIVIDNRKEKIPENELGNIARRLCRRRFSIGADGLMVVTDSRCGGDFRMIFFNSDGSEGEMCGNGARCISKYGYENGLSGAIQKIETAAGTVTGERIDGDTYRVRLNDPENARYNLRLRAPDKEFDCDYVELGHPGIPHCIAYCENLESISENELREYGRSLRFNSVFPKGANVNFYDFTGPDTLFERTFERGVEDFTYACGTGTGSLVWLLTQKGKLPRGNIRVSMAGGTLSVNISDGIYLTGPAVKVCEGKI